MSVKKRQLFELLTRLKYIIKNREEETKMNFLRSCRNFKISSIRAISSKCQLPSNFSIIKEVQKTVDPFSSIRVSSNFPLQIKPYDFVDCPDSNLFRARIHGQELENHKNAQMLIEIDGKNIKVVNNFKGKGELPVCVLEVPVKSDLKIESEDSVSISEMYSDYIKVEAEKDIQTSNLKSSTVDLGSENGKIQCDGLILAHRIDVHSEKGVSFFFNF